MLLKKKNYKNRITGQKVSMDYVDFLVYVVVEIVQNNAFNIKNESTDKILNNFHVLNSESLMIKLKIGYNDVFNIRISIIISFIFFNKYEKYKN